MDADELSVLPPTSTDYSVYGASQFMQGTRTWCGEPGDECFRPVGAALSSRATADSRSVFADWEQLTGGQLQFNYEKLDMQWAVRLTYQQSTDNGADHDLLLYTNLDRTRDILELQTGGTQGPQTLVDIILCDSVEDALTVIQRIVRLDLADELKQQVYPREMLTSPTSLDAQYYEIVDIRTAEYPELAPQE